MVVCVVVSGHGCVSRDVVMSITLIPPFVPAGGAYVLADSFFGA